MSLRALDVEATLATEKATADKVIEMAAKNAEQARAVIEFEAARADETAAKEAVETVRETASADRERQLALIRAREQADVDDVRVKSESGTILAMAQAEAKGCH